MRQIIYAILVLGLGSANALGDRTPGASKAEVCFTCHQPQHRLAAMPLLEGQPAEYLYAQLKAYKEKRRPDPTMTMPPSAANLSDTDMRDISKYLANRTPPSVRYQVDSTKARLGSSKAAALGCGECHGISHKASARAPRLAGQAFGYSMAQLQAFADGRRIHGVGSNAAPQVSLNATDIEDLANYYASLQ